MFLLKVGASLFIYLTLHARLILCLLTAVASTFESVPNDFWESCGSFSPRLMYAVGVIHGVLRARQMFGAVGLSQSYPIDGSTYMHAIESLIAASSPNNTSGNNIAFLCDMLTSVISQPFNYNHE